MIEISTELAKKVSQLLSEHVECKRSIFYKLKEIKKSMNEIEDILRSNSPYPEELNEEKVKTEWRPVQYESAISKESESWTISQVNEPAWATDSGWNGYGLPYKVAKWICDRLNESNQKCPYAQYEDGSWL